MINDAGSNHVFNISIRDRLFGTGHQLSEDGHEAMTIGIEQMHIPLQNAFHAKLQFSFASKLGHCS